MLTGQPAQREGLDGPPQSLEPVSGGSSAKETSVHGGKDGKKKVDIHVEIEKPDIKGKLKDAKSAVKDKVAATKLEVEKKVDALKGTFSAVRETYNFEDDHLLPNKLIHIQTAFLVYILVRPYRMS